MVKLIITISLMSMVSLFLCEQVEDTLILSHVMARHGHRTAEMDFVFPTYPLQQTSFYPYGPGELTLEGKKIMAGVGRALRERYRNFLGDCYSHGLIEAISSGYKRTMMSLQLILAGLFIPSNSCVLKGNLNWQPVPFSYLPFKTDKIIAAHRTCPNIFAVQTTFNKDTLELNKYLTEHAGFNITNSFDIYTIFWSIQNLLDLGFEAPEWSVSVWPQLIRDEENIQFFDDLVDQKLKMLSGSLMVKIHEDSQKKINGTFEPKMVVYSGHEINIAGLMGACEIFNREFINYGKDSLILAHVLARHGHRTTDMDFVFPTYPLQQTSFYPYGPGEITLEGKKLMAGVGKALRERYRVFLGDCYSHGLIEAISSDYKRTMMSLQVLYENYEFNKPEVRKLPGCSEFCEFEKFVEITEKFYPNENWCS
ncbi:PREDICTED: venom acid phosphatase Acph-1-like [Nicrophorus vespilloides]|uniref:acid phosphatase n=1 Tax=Nicrophorus vespilloides TaxID=110193 RepID=A0ABM1N1K2_NICVS|nr:PREDICTED: venom acid phosphatase Acph-1-like [Nicrophorus vespilloides]